MRMLFMIYDVDFDEDVMETLSTCCVTGYTKWGRVLGKGERSDPKLDDAVWPVPATWLPRSKKMAVENELEPTVFEALKALHKRMGGKGPEGLWMAPGKGDLDSITKGGSVWKRIAALT